MLRRLPADQIPLLRNEIAALFSILIIEPTEGAPSTAMVRLAATLSAPRPNLPLPAVSPANHEDYEVRLETNRYAGWRSIHVLRTHIDLLLAWPAAVL